MNNLICRTFKKVALICYFLFSYYSFAFSQSFEYSCFTDYKTTISYIDDDLSPIFNIKRAMGACIRNTDENTYLKIFYINRSGLIIKEIPLINNFGRSKLFTAFDTNLIVLSTGCLDLEPIIIYRLNQKGIFELITKIDLAKQKRFIHADDISLLNEHSLMLSSAYIYSDYKKIGLAKLNINSKKIEKIISFPINEYEFRYSHFPKQWIAFNKRNIAVASPFAQKIILLDTSLNKIKEINVNDFNLAYSEKEFYNKIDTAFFSKNEHYPKNIIDYFFKNKLLNLRRIERVSFLNEDELLISIIDSSFEFKRQLYIINIDNNKIIDYTSVDYRDSRSSNIIDTRYSTQLFFDEKGKSINTIGEDSVNENEIYYKVKQFKLNSIYSDKRNTISSDILSNIDIRTVKNERNNVNLICNYKKVLFMNIMFCFSDYCLKDIDKSELVIFITNTDNYVSNFSTKNTLEKKYKFENILFIKEDVFGQLKSIIPNKEYYILTK